MKKIVFVLMVAATMLFAVSPLFAQGGKMMLGFKAGLNLANVTGDDVGDTSNKSGLAAGGFMSYSITEIFAIQPELLFTMKGTKASDEDVSWSINYLEIPVLLKVTLPTDGKIKPLLYAGPGFGFLLSSKQSDGTEVDVKDFTASTDIGIIAGAGIDYKMETSAITFEARYEVGMTSIGKEEDGETPDIKNSVLTFMLGYGFAF
jgi:hypothetical protein